MTMRIKRGQTAIEFLVLVGAAFFFFLVTLGIIYSNIASKDSIKRDIAINQEASVMADEANLAAEAGDGYIRSFTFPDTLIGNNYNLTIVNGRSAYAVTTDGRHAVSVPTVNVTGQPIVGATNTIRNVNGSVILNQ